MTCPSGQASATGATACSTYTSLSLTVSLSGLYNLKVDGKAILGMSASRDWRFLITKGLIGGGVQRSTDPVSLTADPVRSFNFSNTLLESTRYQASNLFTNALAAQPWNGRYRRYQPFANMSSTNLALLKIRWSESLRGINGLTYGVYSMDGTNLLLYLLDSSLNVRRPTSATNSTVVSVKIATLRGVLGLNDYTFKVRPRFHSLSQSLSHSLLHTHVFSPTKVPQRVCVRRRQLPRLLLGARAGHFLPQQHYGQSCAAFVQPQRQHKVCPEQADQRKCLRWITDAVPQQLSTR